MNLQVNSAALQDSSRQMRRTVDAVGNTPGAVHQAFTSVGASCGDGGCAALATSLAGAWNLALGGLSASSEALAKTTESAGGSYADTERVVMHAVGTAR
ncbi:hypothetical protein IEE94_06955 [Yimella sp. cx-573]|nr:hypothetical protein [Yimella sp. cx-573]